MDCVQRYSGEGEPNPAAAKQQAVELRVETHERRLRRRDDAPPPSYQSPADDESQHRAHPVTPTEVESGRARAALENEL